MLGPSQPSNEYPISTYQNPLNKCYFVILELFCKFQNLKWHEKCEEATVFYDTMNLIFL
jgi:hypothetical protein